MKILLLRFSSIGDIVLTTPVVRVLRQQLGAEVHFFTKKKFASILSANPYLEKVWALDGDMAAQLQQLKAERFDYVLDLHKNLRTWRVTWALGRKTYRFQKLNFEKWLLTRFKINRMPEKHIVARYMAPAERLGVTYDGAGLDHFIPEADKVEAAAVDVRLRGEYTAVVIGAAHATKRLPVEKLAALCRELSGPVALLGGPDDKARADELEALLGDKVVHLCGALNLQQSASILAQSAQVITHDTGLMHIAAALRRPIISVWGNTVPEFGMYPFYPDGFSPAPQIEVKGLACRPCSKIGHASCPKTHFKCMNMIDIAQVVDVAKKP